MQCEETLHNYAHKFDGRNSRLEAPRRYGKTSLVPRTSADAEADAEGERTASRRVAQAGLVELGPLEPVALAESIGARFEANGREVADALGPLLDLAGGHPQRAMMLAYHLFENTRPRGSADSDTWTAALADACLEIDGEIQAAWRALSRSQQRLVAVIADGSIGFATRAANERYGLSRSGGHRAALESLAGDGQIARADTPSGWKLVDPLFGLWLRGGRAWPALR